MATGGSGLNWFAATFAGSGRPDAESNGLTMASQWPHNGLTLLQHLDHLAEQRPPGKRIADEILPNPANARIYLEGYGRFRALYKPSSAPGSAACT